MRTKKEALFAEHPGAGATALVADLIEKAVCLGASDIHFEPRENGLKVRFRVDGLLREGITVQKSMMPAVTARIKIMAGADIGENRLPQDGKAFICSAGRNLDIRVSTIPTLHGEKAVLRLLFRDHALKGLEELGMEADSFKAFSAAIQRPQGLILVTGPTGSGKTTTLYSALNKINSPQKNIITIEDPVEYQLSGINQIQVNYKAGLTFAKGLRSILRQDPDVIMVGEIRDADTARIAVQAALTGHLVFSTLHTNSAAGVVERLADMGVEPYLISSSLICVVAQRLLRLSCPPCKECGFTGYKGRVGIYEILEVDEEIRTMIARGASKKEVEVKAGLKPLYEAGMDKFRAGITTEEELRRVVWGE